MAGMRFKGAISGVASGTSTKTIMQIVAPANQGIKIDEIAVSFQGTNNTQAPILVEVLRQTSAGTMTSLSLFKDPVEAWNIQATAQHTATAEPTAGDIIMRDYVHPQSGMNWQAPFGREIRLDGGTRLGIRVTASADTPTTVRIAGEE